MAQRSTNGTVYELDGPSGKPVVALVHGLGLTRETWEAHIPLLAQEYRVLSYDLFGHGESALPPDTPSVTLFSNQLKELLDELNVDKTAIVGFSLGGMINRRFAMDYPEKVTALAVLNSPHDRGEEAQRLVEQRAADTSAGGPEAGLDTTIKRWFTPSFIKNHPDIINRIRSWVLANDPLSYAQCRAVLAHGVKELIRPNPPITHPTLVMTCENDTGSTPKMSHDIAGEIKGAQTIIVPKLQHMGLVEEPNLLASEVLKFLRDHI